MTVLEPVARLIATSSATSAYAYSGTGYANPDAVTSIGGTTMGYDNAGNATSSGSSTFSWDWRGRLNTSRIAATSSTYSYDENDKRAPHP